MKIQYKLGIMVLGLLAFNSCEKNDPFADNMQIGQYVPTTYWELGSTACKAGDEFTFTGKYWTEDSHTPSHSEVWYSVFRIQEGEASVKLAGTLVSYTESILEEDTVRTSMMMASFPHSDAIWDGYQYSIAGGVPTSLTLSPLKWSPKEWGEIEEQRLGEYFPKNFTDSFSAHVIKSVAKETNNKALRAIFSNYMFDNADVKTINTKYNVNIPILSDSILSLPDKDVAAITYKQGLWYEADTVVVAYYYETIKDGSSVVNRVELDNVNIAFTEENAPYYENTPDKPGFTPYDTATGNGDYFLYEIYDAAEWTFCRYDDNQGAVVTTVKPEYLPAFAELFEKIPFAAWVKNGEEGYAVSFDRKYQLKAQFKVYDTEGNVGVAYDTHTVTIN